MQQLHQGKGSKGRRRRTSPRSSGNLGHFASSFPKKKDKGASDSKAAVANNNGSNDDAIMSAHAPREKRWGDMDI